MEHSNVVAGCTGFPTYPRDPSILDIILDLFRKPEPSIPPTLPVSSGNGSSSTSEEEQRRRDRK